MAQVYVAGYATRRGRRALRLSGSHVARGSQGSDRDGGHAQAAGRCCAVSSESTHPGRRDAVGPATCMNIRDWKTVLLALTRFFLALMFNRLDQPAQPGNEAPQLRKPRSKATTPPRRLGFSRYHMM